MAPVTDGDTLLLHFTSTRPDGEVFEDTRSGEPVRVTLGGNRINPLFEEALIGKEPGETVTVSLPPEKAYGKFNRKLVVTVKRTKLKLDHEPVVGEFVRVEVLGKPCLVTVLDVDEKYITVDANHPLAGETITYAITVEAILPREG
ncbi:MULTISPECIES: FKBP-type peptidyl-prolyl cis-trans isomerase [Methanoculleus]|uniref:Peptidyl-prolyl cis-trans isomerase n=2 Tax=Methanoculleus TaxID=45989 RepID=A3CUM6_METMJ|nr:MULTISPECIES: FKBP-type peptidyl-prolyl cis-trans isomerase [Methanoculleus]ABN57076.1 peptidylprolyl isomerase, FKBP-type [Methanoculleus marisnigri JR1]UYU18494.1 FKBP-type peptidyl-prolyl cis-trans isomerase [Methanoculleus submarinus]